MTDKKSYQRPTYQQNLVNAVRNIAATKAHVPDYEMDVEHIKEFYDLIEEGDISKLSVHLYNNKLTYNLRLSP